RHRAAPEPDGDGPGVQPGRAGPAHGEPVPRRFVPPQGEGELRWERDLLRRLHGRSAARRGGGRGAARGQRARHDLHRVPGHRFRRRRVHLERLDRGGGRQLVPVVHVRPPAAGLRDPRGPEPGAGRGLRQLVAIPPRRRAPAGRRLDGEGRLLLRSKPRPLGLGLAPPAGFGPPRPRPRRFLEAGAMVGGRGELDRALEAPLHRRPEPRSLRRRLRGARRDPRRLRRVRVLAMRARLLLHPVALSALLAALLLPAPARAQVSFTVYVSVGDSLAAGFSNGTLVETHQRNSVPALLARQAGASGFEQPLVSAPGIPPELALLGLVPVATIAPSAQAPGSPLNLALNRPYNNLAVP